MVFEYQDSAGQRRQKSESTGLPEKGNKRRAQQMLDNRLDELSQQYTAALENRNVLFLSFMRSWLNDVMSYKVRDTTMTQYNYVFDSYIAEYKPFHGVKLQELTPALLQSYYNTQLKAGLSPNTVRKHHANIHKCLDYAVRLGMITVNPSIMTELPLKRKYQGATAYTPEQLRELLNLFQKDPLETPYVTPHFQRKLKEVRLPVIRFHDLRHSAVYALRKGGCDAKDIQAWLGHSDITTTLNVYGHVLGGDMDRLGKVMDNVLFDAVKAS